jgi:hypothetical protein
MPKRQLLRSFDRAERTLLLVLDEAQVLASPAHSDRAHSLLHASPAVLRQPRTAFRLEFRDGGAPACGASESLLTPTTSRRGSIRRVGLCRSLQESNSKADVAAALRSNVTARLHPAATAHSAINTPDRTHRRTSGTESSTTAGSIMRYGWHPAACLGEGSSPAFPSHESAS